MFEYSEKSQLIIGESPKVAIPNLNGIRFIKK